MNTNVYTSLRQLIEQDPSLLHNPTQLRTQLKAFHSELAREVNCIFMAAQEAIALQVFGAAPGSAISNQQVEQWSAQINQNWDTTPESARWAVEGWLFALRRHVAQEDGAASLQPSPSSPIPFDWVEIPAGPFWMGSHPQDEDSQRLDAPQHRLYLPTFFISRFPVTVTQYHQFVEATEYNLRVWGVVMRNAEEKGKQPAYFISWHDACAFCEWAGVQLPTEAQWEKAARGPDGLTYPWGETLPNKLRCNLQRFPTNVDQFPNGASPYGVMDMLGNVWEWTRNTYVDYPYTVGGPHELLTATGRRVLRGGSYNAKPNQIRASMRLRQNAGKEEINYGFRVAWASS